MFREKNKRFRFTFAAFPAILGFIGSNNATE